MGEKKEIYFTLIYMDSGSKSVAIKWDGGY